MSNLAPIETRGEQPPELLVRDAAAWGKWLDRNHSKSRGVRLVLSKKGAIHPTSLTYDEALEEALAHGWIDGQGQRRDETSWRVRFTPRRRRSPWSERNTVIAERLITEGRMHSAGLAEIERAKAEGRWPTRYDDRARTRAPDELS